MFDDVVIPLKLSNPPIRKAVIEFRYESAFQEAAIYGLLIDIFEQFPKENFLQTPFGQVPSDVRKNDLELKYQVVFQSYKENEQKGKYLFGIGAYSIQFAVLDSYISWVDWMKFVRPIMDEIQNKKIIGKIELVRLQYWDLFENDIIPLLNANLVIDNKNVNNQPVSFKTTFKDDDISVITNVGNKVSINGQKMDNTSLIDIECLKEVSNTGDIEGFYSEYENILVKEHFLNKKYFFGLLKKELLDTLGPEYDK